MMELFYFFLFDIFFMRCDCVLGENLLGAVFGTRIRVRRRP